MREPARRWPTPATAAVAAVAAAAAGLALPYGYQAVASAALGGAMGAIAAEDLARFRAPDAANLLAALMGLATAWIAARARVGDPLASVGGALLQGLLCGGALLLLREAFYRLRGVDGLGLGDVKLAGVAGIWLGWELFAVAVTLAAVAALVYVALRSLREGGWPRARRIPFAACLAPAIWVCWYAAQLWSG
jgi:leader peptidase (prepilin peptidase)/N-methyltransferase